MCSIFGSYSVDEFEKLYTLNSYRGAMASSISIFDSEGVCALQKYSRPLVEKDFEALRQLETPGLYFLGHSQAPTTQSEQSSSIHPSIYQGSLLWHNGIIKPKTIEALNKELDLDEKWDTSLIHIILHQRGFEALSEVNGSFACAMTTAANCVYLFRNEISPLFVDDRCNISSTMFEGSYQIEPNLVYLFDVNEGALEATNYKFSTCENPFFFGV